MSFFKIWPCASPLPNLPISSMALPPCSPAYPQACPVFIAISHGMQARRQGSSCLIPAVSPTLEPGLAHSLAGTQQISWKERWVACPRQPHQPRPGCYRSAFQLLGICGGLSSAASAPAQLPHGPSGWPSMSSRSPVPQGMCVSPSHPSLICVGGHVKSPSACSPWSAS